jgi:hypothetical protein
MRGTGRRLAFVAIALAVALAGGACSSDTTEAPDQLAGLAEVREMLSRRAAALAAGDVEGYLRPLNAQARAFEEPIARAALALPLTAFALVFNPPEGTNVLSPAFRNVPVEFRYRYKDLPEDNTFHFTVNYDMERQNGAWVVTRADSEPSDPAPLWATGPAEISTSEHFLALHRPGAALVGESLALAEKARAELAPKLTLRQDDRHLMVLVGAPDELSDFIGERLGAGLIAVARSWTSGNRIPDNRELLFDVDATFGDTSRQVLEHGVQETDLTPQQVFQHELAHLALARSTPANMPAWVFEGAAMYLAGVRRVIAWRDGLETGLFDRLSFVELNREGGDLGGAGYAYANAAVLHLVEAFGAPKFWQFYADFERENNPRPDVILRSAYQIEARELDRRTRSFIEAAVS